MGELWHSFYIYIYINIILIEHLKVHFSSQTHSSYSYLTTQMFTVFFLGLFFSNFNITLVF